MLENFRYRAEIDGLRAVAVVAVVLYHAGIGLSGGYVGVDVFFVISGFLITSLIVKDIQGGRFSMLDFWERRARRILPASVFMALSVSVLGWFLLLPSDFVGFARALISQATFVSNIYFWKNTGYFAGSAEEMPLLHTWSLSVEEQFYMVVPCVLFIIFKLLKSRGLTATRYAIGVGFIAVFGFEWLSTRIDFDALARRHGVLNYLYIVSVLLLLSLFGMFEGGAFIYFQF